MRRPDESGAGARPPRGPQARSAEAGQSLPARHSSGSESGKISKSGGSLALSGALAGGTLAANQTRIIGMNNLISGGLRGSLVVTINAPLSQVDVLYQVTQQSTGVTSNTLLSYT